MSKLVSLLLLADGTIAAEYTLFSNRTSYKGHGGVEIDSDSTAPTGLSVEACEDRCDADVSCDCVSFRPISGKCWKRAACVPSEFWVDADYSTYVKSHPKEGGNYEYKTWSAPIKNGHCSNSSEPLEIKLKSRSGVFEAILTCALQSGTKQYVFPSGIFEIDEQLLVPEHVSISGSRDPNDMAEPTRTPDWAEQTLFLATRGAVDYHMNYCHAADMVTTRVGFVLSSGVSVRNLSYQGIDVIRPQDNGGLCGGAAFETKGCAENNCDNSDVNNGGSDGFGSVGVTIENVRINDYYYAEDRHKIGILPEPCCTDNQEQCHFCNPNGIRSTQVGIWVPDVRNNEGTRDLFVNNVVSRSGQADAINLHGNVHNAIVQNAYMENTGDDMFVLWGGNKNPTNVTFKDCTAVNPGVTRPGWYGNCGATYGVMSLVYENMTCKVPALSAPFPGHPVDNTMFAFFKSFGGGYPEGSSIVIKGWTFEDLNGNAYVPQEGSLDHPQQGKMTWTRAEGGLFAPFYYVNGQIEAKVDVSQSPAPRYIRFSGFTSYDGHGGMEIDSDSTAPTGLTVQSCESRCDADNSCDCVSFRPTDGKCWKRGSCVPSEFEANSDYDTYVTNGPEVVVLV